MDFTVVTPSFNQLDQLSCCIGSIADQEGVSVEHIVQDGGTEGFLEFAQRMRDQWPDRPGYRRIMVTEKDGGMYDAINRGFEKGKGAFCAYLNCDEQYLPETLKRVVQAFRSHPGTDLFFGDALVLDEKGSARCWRKVLVPLLAHTWTCHFSAFTAAMFFRRRLWDEGIRFDTSYRAAADAAWYLETRRRGIRAATLGFPASTFTETGGNLGLQRIAKEERTRLNRSAPCWMRILWPIWFVTHRIRRWLLGALTFKSLGYAVYLPGQAERTFFQARNLAGYWPGRWHRA